MPDHRLLHRLISGRFWIGLIGFALLGIVAMQLSLLKLNTGIGRALEHEALLQRENASLRVQVSSLSAADRVEQLAAQMGMVSAAPGAIHFLAPGRGDASRAAAALASSSSTATSASTPSGSTPSASTPSASAAPTPLGSSPPIVPATTTSASATTESTPASTPAATTTATAPASAQVPATPSAPVTTPSAPASSAPAAGG